MSNLIPEPMTQDELVAVLTDMMLRVREGDSWEGNIEYLMPDEADDPEVRFRVRGAYRIGNTFGQGAMRLIGTVPG